MNLLRVRPWLLASCVVLLHACSDNATEAPATKPAIGHVDPATTVADESFESSCRRVAGQWQAETQQCAVTEALCANFGRWQEETGCIVASVEPTECVGMSGLQVVGDSCVITRLSLDELAQTGLSEEK